MRAGSLGEALLYPLRPPALAAHFGYAALHGLASLLPLFLPLVAHAALWLGWYRYATECLATSAQGRTLPPEVLAEFGNDTHLRHSWIHLLLLTAVGAIRLVAPDQAVAVALLAAWLMPGLVITLSINQSLGSALNPLNWAIVALRLGVLRYLLLGLGWLLVLLLVFGGADALLAQLPLPRLLASLVSILSIQYLILLVFHVTGRLLHRHGHRLGHAPSQPRRPLLARQREETALGRQVAQARALADPAERARALREAVQRGADEAVQREYRDALRAAGDLAALDAHAAVRTSELVVRGDLARATPLAIEALADNPAFTLPEAEQLEPLLDHLCRRAQWRTAAALADNYVRRHPKREDAARLARHAAHLLAERLEDTERAIELLDLVLASARHPERLGALAELRERLRKRPTERPA
ncbi:MAG: hypothetical protein KatS3mg126_1340 [Lysobacteraceae bacterium]|nr:MAG: hypothetical protein KatS3mg126_1340 [Xanthomonadaceae bacterium]